MYTSMYSEKVTSTYYDVSSSLILISVGGGNRYSCFTENPEHPLYITYLPICICKNWNTFHTTEHAGFRVAEFIYACVVEQEQHIDVQIKEVQCPKNGPTHMILLVVCHRNQGGLLKAMQNQMSWLSK